MNRANVPHHTLQIGISEPSTDSAGESHCSLSQYWSPSHVVNKYFDTMVTDQKS